MISSTGNTYIPTDASPPGATLRDILEDRGISQADLAARMGRPQKTISEIINGKAAVTPETALELELVLGIQAGFWVSREGNYRAYLARKDQESELATAVEWASRFPVRQMAKVGWISNSRGPALAKELLEFFGVASPDQWEDTALQPEAAFRRSARYESDVYATSAWLRQGVREAELREAAPYDRDRFVTALQQARALTVEEPQIFQDQLAKLCNGGGVIVSFTPEIPKCRASGATRWLSPKKALIQLSLRYKSNDHLWFTFFHEAGHLLLHGKRIVFVEGSDSEDGLEEQANEFARDFLIPPEDFLPFLDAGDFSKWSILEFAATVGIAPGIVVGRLQHEGLLQYNQCNDLKVRYRWVHEE